MDSDGTDLDGTRPDGRSSDAEARRPDGRADEEARTPAASAHGTVAAASLSSAGHEVSEQACLDLGFYVVDHGISQEFMDGVFAQSKDFFDLPYSEKMKLLCDENNRGYTPMLDEIIDPENQVNGDYKEGYYIGVEVATDNPEANKPFYGPKWREVMEQYHREAL